MDGAKWMVRSRGVDEDGGSLRVGVELLSAVTAVELAPISVCFNPVHIDAVHASPVLAVLAGVA